MTRKKDDEVRKEELEEQNGEELPDREVMSVVSVDPQPIEATQVDPADFEPRVGPPEDPT
jgi:hypothetical protein